MFFLCLTLLAAFLVLKARGDERRQNEEFLRKLRESFGRFSEDGTSGEALRILSGRAAEWKETKERGFVDDITWRDLEMDEVFRRMNTALSEPGEEALYELLRRPVRDKELLEKRGRIIKFFAENPEERLKLQEAFHRMGRRGKYALSDYLSLLDNIREESNLRHYFSALLGLFSVSMIFIKPAAGFVIFIAVLIINVTTYFKRKGEIDSSLSAFSYILRSLGEIRRLPQINAEELSEEMKKIRETGESLKILSRGAFLILSGRDLTGSFLQIPLDYLRIFLHVDLMKFNSMLSLVRSRSEDIRELFGTVGFLDAMIAAASFREALKVKCKPEFTDEKYAYFEAEDLYHPLLENPVSASISTSGKGVLLTGSNASGKSTFLKSAGLSILLAQTIYTAPAKALKLSFLDIYSSMSLSDSLVGNESYYMAEIRAVKRIADRVARDPSSGLPGAACFLDELLRGTNTLERIAASSGILKTLKKEHTLVFAATHDLELTGMLENYYDNYHFEDEVNGNDITFSYRLNKGRAKTRNAIKLLELIGFDPETVKGAFRTAERFEKEGTWERI